MGEKSVYHGKEKQDDEVYLVFFFHFSYFYIAHSSVIIEKISGFSDCYVSRFTAYSYMSVESYLLTSLGCCCYLKIKVAEIKCYVNLRLDYVLNLYIRLLIATF